MSMAIDLSTPLTDEERDYLAMRGRYAEIQQADQLTGVEEPPELPKGDDTGPKIEPLMTSEQRANRRAALEEELRKLRDLDGDTGEEPEGDVEPYEVWDPKELKEEIDRRNEGRTDETKISKSGSKQQLAQRLYADDAEEAQPQS